MPRKRVTASITGTNQFTDWYQFRPSLEGQSEKAGLRIGDNTAFNATIVVQTKNPEDAASTAADIESYTTPERKTLEFYEKVDVRVGIPTGGTYSSGTIPVRISNY